MTITAAEEPMTTQQPRTLAALRRKAGLSQSDVAKRMGVGQPRVSQIERDYPNLHLTVLSAYIEALGGHLALTGIDGLTIPASDVTPSQWDKESLAKIRERRRQSAARMNAETARRPLPEELPLQSDAAEPGGDDTGGQVDHPDAESDQSDRDEGQQP